MLGRGRKEGDRDAGKEWEGREEYQEEMPVKSTSAFLGLVSLLFYRECGILEEWTYL